MCSFLFTNRDASDFHYVNEYMEKRGPDKTTITEVGDHTFVHNILSITGEFKPQPFVNQERQIVCVYNGEIYNADNYSSDGESIIPRYLQYGFFFPMHVDGEFAICLVDYANRKILVTTDTFSTKPIWIAREDGDIGIASYESSLLRLGFKKPEKVPANTRMLIDLDTFETKDVGTVYKFKLDQNKNTFDDWNAAFAESIRKRTANLREQLFIGLSSGYDSGAIACELLKQNVPHKAYSLTGTENMDVLMDRNSLYKKEFIHEISTLPEHKRAPLVNHIASYVEPFNNTIHSSSSDYNEYGTTIVNDHGAGSLAYICLKAKKDNRKVYLSGSGADEIFSDYGFDGQKKYAHSNFGGLYPDDLSTIFPWASFYGSSQETYIAKEEHVAGSYGLETRYPYLDKYVVQEFLSLTPELKNSKYKSVLHNYLTLNHFPFSENEKIGF